MLAPRHRLPQARVVQREDYLLDLCKDKDVLHIGCADWPYTQERLDSAALLHGRLAAVCRRLVGVDASEEGLAVLAKHGVTDLFTRDIAELDVLCREMNWVPDLILVTEVLEHLDAPGPALRAVAKAMGTHSELVITVPNTFSIKGFLHMMLGREKVHPDHVAYYSVMNLRQLLSRCELGPSHITSYCSPGGDRLDRLLNKVLHLLWIFRPFFADGILVRVSRDK